MHLYLVSYLCKTADYPPLTSSQVFLRVLEYYEGILILTTNRVGVFDDAFKSRVHVSLCYPPLTEQQTYKIWEKNLNRLRKIEDARAQVTEKPRLRILDKDILAYAKQHYQEHKDSRLGWNGRQIRNAFQTAAALAYHNADEYGPILTDNLFKQVAQTTDEFDKYINAVNGEKNEEQRAFDRVERIDVLTKESGEQLKRISTVSQPTTPVPSPGDRGVFGKKSFRDTQTMDSNYAIHGGMTGERASFSSSANSSQFMSESTRTSDNMWASPGAPRHSDSPSITPRTATVSNTDVNQRYNAAMRSIEGDRAGYLQ